MKNGLKKIRRKAEIIQKTSSYLPSFNEKINSILEVNNISYGKDKNNILDIYYKNDLNDAKTIIFVHGGGWCSYNKDFYRTPLKRISNMNTVVFNCNYALAPEHDIDDMEKDIFKILDYVVENTSKYGGSNKKIILMGDSAGAHLVSLVTSKLFMNKYDDNKYKNNIIGLGLFYGVYNLYDAKNSKFPNIKTFINSIIDVNSSKENMDKISPIYYITKELPKVFITSGEYDRLHKESVNYYNALIKKHVKVEKLFFKKDVISARHSFLNYNYSKACKESLKKFNEFLNNL